MSQIQPAGWYRDPTSTYEYRYWDGGGWTERVSTGGTSGTDPNPLDPTVAATPPAPGSAAPSQPATAPPSVQVTQSGGGGSSFGTIIGVVFAVVAVVVLIVVLFAIAGDDDSSSESVPGTAETPVETEAPADEAPATTAGS